MDEESFDNMVLEDKQNPLLTKLNKRLFSISFFDFFSDHLLAVQIINTV
jgi:hypothetical protein